VLVKFEASPEVDELDPSDDSDDEKPEHDVIVISDDEPAPKRPKTKATQRSAQAAPGRAKYRRWSSDELLLLLDAAMTDDPQRFLHAVPGRTKVQCESAWRCTIYPAFVEMLKQRGK
jgi:hypothetical protein